MAEKKKYLDALVEAEHFINHLFGAPVEVVYACFERDIAEVARKDVVRLREYGTALAYSIKQSALERNWLTRQDSSRMGTEELWNCSRRITYLDDVIRKNYDKLETYVAQLRDARQVCEGRKKAFDYFENWSEQVIDQIYQ